MPEDNNQSFPPADPIDPKLADALKELNSKLRGYFEDNVKQNTNALNSLIERLSRLDETNANIEKILQELPKSAAREEEIQKKSAEALTDLTKLVEELKEQKEEEIELLKQQTAIKVARYAAERAKAAEAKEKAEVEGENKIRERGVTNFMERAVKALTGGKDERKSHTTSKKKI
jgi:predicted transcriptional regulator